MMREVAYAVRVLRRTPLFAVPAVLCLGLAIGANTALFSILDALLWKPLPVRDPSAIVRVFTRGPVATYFYQGFSYPEYMDYRNAGVFAALSATSGVALAFRSPETGPIRVFGDGVSDDYFEMLGVGARFGRMLRSNPDGSLNRSPEVVLSDRFWRRRLHSPADVIGRTIWLTGVAFTVVGVAPPEFKGTYATSVFAPELWIPIGSLPLVSAGAEPLFHDRAIRRLSLLGRLTPRADVPQAQAAIATVATGLEATYPQSNTGVRPFVFNELDTRPEVYNSRAVNVAGVLFLLFGALVLAVACANVANLMVARAGARRKEIAVRVALGAGRARLTQEVLSEAIVLSAASTPVALVVAFATSRAVAAVSLPTDLPIVLDVTIDTRVLVFTILVAALATAALGTFPALGASRLDIASAMKDVDVAQGRHRRLSVTNALLVAQVAFSLVLLVAAGLFWRSIGGAATIDPGMQLENRALVSFNPALLRYDEARTRQFYRGLLERVRQSPDVDDAALVSWVPLGFAADEGRFVISGREERHSDDRLTTFVNVVTPEFFDTVGVNVLQGRAFTREDDARSDPVVMVNETFAARAWPGQNVVGRQVRDAAPDAPWLTVVGIVADGKYRTLTESPQAYLLRPLAQSPTTALTLVARSTRGHAAALATIRREAQALDPDMPLLDVKTMDQQMAKVRFLPRAMTALALPAAILALVIAALGLYSVIAYSVSRRTREFGIRLAIGATSSNVIRQVMAQGSGVLLVGLLAGTAAALGLARVIRGLLVGVAPGDPLALAAAIALVVATAAAAMLVPARQASRVDPVVALRQQ